MIFSSFISDNQVVMPGNFPEKWKCYLKVTISSYFFICLSQNVYTIGKGMNQLFSLQLWVNNRADWVLKLSIINNLEEGKLWFQNLNFALKNHHLSHSVHAERLFVCVWVCVCVSVCVQKRIYFLTKIFLYSFYMSLLKFILWYEPDDV